MKHWFEKFAESYFGSNDIANPKSTEEGSESPNSSLNDSRFNGGVQVNSDGTGEVPDYQQAMHPSSVDGEQTLDQGNRPNATPPQGNFAYGEEAVDDNHANVSASLLSLFASNDDIAGGGANFLGDAADSPKTLHDGHSDSELENNQQGINYAINTPTNTPLEPPITDPTATHPDDTFQNISQINQPQTFAHLKQKPRMFGNSVNPTLRSSRDIKAEVLKTPNNPKGYELEQPAETIEHMERMCPSHQLMPKPHPTDYTPPGETVSPEQRPPEPGDIYNDFNAAPVNVRPGQSSGPVYVPRLQQLPWGANIYSKNALNESNVADVLTNPNDEAAIKHDKSNTDFGTGDQTGTEQTMIANPAHGVTDDAESELFSGIAPQGSLLSLFTRADYGYVAPSVNPNSGPDEKAEDKILADPPAAMTDGAQPPINSDKDEDPNYQRRNPTYNEQEGDSSGYYGFSGNGGGFGNEGDGQNFSGISH